MKGMNIGTYIYILKKDHKILTSENLLVSRKGIRTLSLKEMNIVKKLQTRPLFEAELEALSDETQASFKKVNFFYSRGFPLLFEANYISSSEERALAWKLIVKAKTTFQWGEELFELEPGFYFFPKYRPRDIHGEFDLTPLQSSDPSSDRDDWILEKIKNNPIGTIVELGAGVESRLKNKIEREFSSMEYIGIDLLKNHQQDNLQGDFLLNYPLSHRPHLALLEEVIEHLEESEVKKLIEICHEHQTTQIIMTTPNAAFTTLIGLSTRHHDHKFEWDKKDLETFIKEISHYAKEVKIEEIGRRINEVFPTWGIVITLNNH